MSSYPPPPPAGPTPPSPYGVPQPAGWDLGTCVGWAWTKFQQNLSMIAGALILVVGVVIIEFAGLAVIAGLTSARKYECDYTATLSCHWTGGTPWIVTELLTLVLVAVILVVAQILAAGMIRGSLAVAEGRAFETSDLFDFSKVGPILVTSLLVGAITLVGTILCIIPGIIASFLLSYALYFVIDKDMAPIDAVKASYELTKANLGTSIVWYLIAGLIATAGVIACGVGIVASIPISLLGTAYTYKKLTGQEVAA